MYQPASEPLNALYFKNQLLWSALYMDLGGLTTSLWLMHLSHLVDPQVIKVVLIEGRERDK